MSKIVCVVMILSFFHLDFSVAQDMKKANWINDPYLKCEQVTQLCAVGEGSGAMVAKANARREIALVFESKIEGSKKFNKSSSQKESSGKISGETNESSFSEIKEITEAVLEGVEILEVYEGEESVYALAVLDKRKASSTFLEKMNKIDQQMDLLLKDEKKINSKKLMRLYKVREGLNLKFNIVKGQFYPEKYTLKDIEKSKGSVTNKISVAINIFEEHPLFPLRSFFMALLTDNDYTVSAKKGDGASFNLDGELKSEEMFLKVEGFKRYQFHLNVFFVNKEGKKIKSLQQDFIHDGRNFTDAKDKALKEIRDFIKKEWVDLTIE